MIYMVEFGEQLRIARENRGLTQQMLAEELSVARQTVSHWECGERYPDIATAKKIAQILDVSIEDLLSGKDMTKMAERNPVIENKLINDLMIVFYTVVIVALVVLPYKRFMGVITGSDIYIMYGEKQKFIGRVGGFIQMAGFLYCLINAVRVNLKPKRIGVGWAIFFISNIVINCSNFIGVFDGSFWGRIVSITVIVCLINSIGLLASVFFFIKKSNNIMWVIILGIISVIGFFGDVFIDFYQTIQELIMHNFHLSISGYASYFMRTVLYVLIIYQALVLYRKRKVVAEITEGES